MPAPTLDGSATGIHTGGTTCAATLTTTQTNDIIVAAVYTEQNNTIIHATGVSGGGLTWALRSRCANLKGTIGSCLEIWWAVAASALSAQVITATFNATTDSTSMVVFGVQGCNTTNPWDANVSLPGRVWNGSGTSSNPTFTNISTANANDFLLFFSATPTPTNPGSNVPAGFTLIGNAGNAAGANWSYLSAAYESVTATQPGASFAWGNGGSAGQTNINIFEALTADAGGTTAVAGCDVEFTCFKSNASPATTLALPIVGITANDTFLILSYCQHSGGAPAISSISGGGLTWTRRGLVNGSPIGSLELWSAQATGTVAYTTATITYAASCGAFAAVFAVVGTTAAIFDSHAGLPATQSNVSTTPWTPSVSAATAQAHDIIIACAASNPISGDSQVPAGFALAQASQVVSTEWLYTNIGLQKRATTTSGTVTWPGSIPDNNGATGYGGQYLVDAITSDIAVSGPPPSDFLFGMAAPSLLVGAAAMRAYRALEKNPTTTRRGIIRRIFALF